jgi:hypothetical protein
MLLVHQLMTRLRGLNPNLPCVFTVDGDIIDIDDVEIIAEVSSLQADIDAAVVLLTMNTPEVSEESNESVDDFLNSLKDL